MPSTRRPVRRNRLRRSRRSARPWIETLELRTLPATLLGPAFLPPVPEAEPNDVVTRAQDLGAIDVLPAAVAGAVGNGTAGAADVDWYQFELAAPAHVTLSTQNGPTGSPLVSALGLYETDPYHVVQTVTGAYAPPYGSPSGYHLLAGAEGNAAAPAATVERDLAPGTYYVAVSGAGNRTFSPLLADSGQPGSTGPYLLSVTAGDLSPAVGPVVLGGDPAPGAAVASSPALLRVALSAPVAYQTVHLNQAPNTVPLDPVNDPVPTDPYGNPLPIPASVWLTYNPTGTFGDGNDQPVLLDAGDVNFAGSELRLQPAAPLAPGYYQLTLAGDSSQHAFVVTDLNGDPLGADAGHPLGQDVTLTFRVTGVEGQAGPAGDDTPATAHELGDVTRLVQVAGAIGDDPNFAAQPGADVDLYHFRLTGPGRYAFDAEAFAGRIGSPLDVGLSLFRLDPADGHTLDLVTANDNTLNNTVGSDGFSLPLFTDATVYAGLTAGDYYLAVSAGGNVPDPALGLAPGVNGVYDLNAGTAYSGTASLTTGDYVLNVLAQPASAPPQVVATTPAEGSTLAAPPTHLSVQFDEPVVLQQLAYQAYQAAQLDPTAAPDALAAVFVRAADGTVYHPRLESYDPTTGRADFLMLDALPNGAYELHLSGARGLTDFAGDPLAGNDPSGDYVVHFTVSGPPRGTDGNPLLWSDRDPNGPDQPQVLGPLFPHELQGSGVVLRGTLSPTSFPPAGEDDYVINLLQDAQSYLFTLSTADVRLEVDDAAGNPLLLDHQAGNVYAATLGAGTYRVRLLDAVPNPGAVAYELGITLMAAPESPAPLTVGPEPSFRIRLVTAAPPGPGDGGQKPGGDPPGSAPSGTSPGAAPPRLTVSVPPPAGPAESGPPSGASSPGRGGLADTPASVVLALTAGPVGGVRGPLSPSAAGDGEGQAAGGRLLVRGPELVARDRLLQVAILTGIDGGSGDAGTPAADPAVARLEALVERYAGQALKSWQQFLDLVFAAGRDAAESSALPVGPADLDPPAPQDLAPDDADNCLGEPEAAVAPPRPVSESGLPAAPYVLLAACCLLPTAFREPPSERKRA